LVQFKEIVVDETKGEIELVHKQNIEASFLLNYFIRTSQYVFDAYLIVLSALEAICEANHVVNETKLINELHASTIEMYDDNLIKELPSCLKELIETALRRFNELDLAVIKHYTTSNGSSISFVSCPFSRLDQLEKLKMKINELQQFSPHEL
jgi:hypothetical protein